MKEDKTLDLTVAFPIKMTRKNAISKASMKKCCKEVFKALKNNEIDFHTANVMGLIADSENHYFDYYFIKYKARPFGYDFSFSITVFKDDEEVSTTLWIDYENEQHRELDFYNSELEINID